MKIAIIGAGFSGLSAAWDLSKKGFDVTIYEKEKNSGGLAVGFKDKGWDWSLENHYHHVFETDDDILQLIKELDLTDLREIFKTKTSTLINGKQYRLDSPISLLKFTPLPLVDRLRVGVVLAFLKTWPFGVFLEKFTAKKFLKATMGNKAWNILWEPLFIGKFGSWVDKVNMSWFWARIYARSKNLGYFKGGFLGLAKAIVNKLKESNVKVLFSNEVKSIDKINDKFSVKCSRKIELFDKVLITSPSPVLLKLVKNLPLSFIEKTKKLKYLAAMTLVIQLDKPFFSDKTYWLNINEKNYPFLAVVDHTNMINKSNYSGNNLLYVGKYLEVSDKLWQFNKEDLFKIYKPFLKKISPDFNSKKVTKKWLFKNSFAQPLVGVEHSNLLPKTKTPIDGLYWISMQHVYPWDRGVNYAVKFGRQVANEVYV